MNDELSIKLFNELEKNPEQSQRRISKNCCASLGSVNYCLNALIKKGFVKAMNFKNSKNKLAYIYILTSSGMNYKKKLSIAFLKRKQAEYKSLKREIALLKKEVGQL